MPTVADFARQSPYSDPGEYRALLAGLPTGLDDVCAVARNVIAHYRAELPDLSADRHGEIDSRWLRRILAVDQSRHPVALAEPRELGSRVAGCCRDHSLFLTSALRERGVPARNVIGFAGYFEPPWHHDHVVTEYWDGTRWVSVDAELTPGDFPFDVRDLPRGPGAVFETAAEVWRGHRAGTLDADQYGVEPSAPPPVRGPEFVGGYVVFQVAHRYGDELLLWDEWLPQPSPELLDRLADLLIRADAGEAAAEDELWQWYHSDPSLRPGRTVTRYSPYGEPPVTDRLDDGQSRVIDQSS
ncbi:MAG: transglutaminase domain-containing protein [Propionibacteriaceae bacterium]|nr:transglutaminase domain-containing protein [Propionibacteriaceae bacterium]